MFKELDASGSDVHFAQGSTLGTVFVGGISADSADAIDMGLTGQLLYITKDGFADGATLTFWNASAWPTPAAGASAYHESLTTRLVDHREIIKRHGLHAGITAYAVGHALNEVTDVNLNLGDGHIQKIYCGPTMGYIHLPEDPFPTSEGITHGFVETLTLILHNAESHGLVTDHWGDGSLEPWQIFKNPGPSDVDFTDREEVVFSDKIDIFNFVYSENISGGDGSSRKWLPLNPSSGYGITFAGYPDIPGACCHGGECEDYITREVCEGYEDFESFYELRDCLFTPCNQSLEGACCTMHTCIQSLEEDCENFQGYFVPGAICGNGWSCNDYPCDEPDEVIGACCIESWTNGESSTNCIDCLQISAEKCDCLNDTYVTTTFYGANSSCSECESLGYPCGSGWACCLEEPCLGDPTGCYNTTNHFCDQVAGHYYENFVCCSDEEETEGDWMGCWIDVDGARGCILGGSLQEVADYIDENYDVSDDTLCRQIMLWDCGVNQEFPECMLPCFTHDVNDDGNPHTPDCMTQLCNSCPTATTDTCLPKQLGCCCIDGVTVPWYTLGWCDAVGGEWDSDLNGDCTDTTCTPGPRGNGGARGDLECVDCEPLGACCIGGFCDAGENGIGMSESECTNMSGTWMDAYSICDDNSTGHDEDGNIFDCCDHIKGACCLSEGTCVQATPIGCKDSGGIFQGIFQQCEGENAVYCCVDEGGEVSGRCCCDGDEDGTAGCACQYYTWEQCQARIDEELCGDCSWSPGQACGDCYYQEPDEDIDICDGPGGWHIFVWDTQISNATIDTNATEDWDALDIILTRGSDGYWNSWGFPKWLCSSAGQGHAMGRGSHQGYPEIGSIPDSNPPFVSPIVWNVGEFPTAGDWNNYITSIENYSYDGPYNVFGMWPGASCTIESPDGGPDLSRLLNNNRLGLGLCQVAYGSADYGCGSVAESSSSDIFWQAANLSDSGCLDNNQPCWGGGDCGDTPDECGGAEGGCGLRMYVPSIHELSFLMRRIQEGFINDEPDGDFGSSGINPTWSSSFRMGTNYQTNPLYAYVQAGSNLNYKVSLVATRQSDGSKTWKSQLLFARWLDMSSGGNSKGFFPWEPNPCDIEGNCDDHWLVGKKYQLQTDGMNMIYLGKYCPGKTMVRGILGEEGGGAYVGA